MHKSLFIVTLFIICAALTNKTFGNFINYNDYTWSTVIQTGSAPSVINNFTYQLNSSSSGSEFDSLAVSELDFIGGTLNVTLRKMEDNDYIGIGVGVVSPRTSVSGTVPFQMFILTWSQGGAGTNAFDGRRFYYLEDDYSITTFGDTLSPDFGTVTEASFRPLDGNSAILASDNANIVNGTPYDFDIYYTTNNIRVDVDGVTFADFTLAEVNAAIATQTGGAGLSEFPSGAIAFYASRQNQARFENMYVTSIANDDAYLLNPNLQGSFEAGANDSVLANDTAVWGTNTGVELATNASNGNVTLNANGTFTYTPTTVSYGTDSFTYNISTNNIAAQSDTPGTVTIRLIQNVPFTGANF